MQPLNGIRVLDLSRVLAGPYCTMVLGDLGADVIKVEAPEGDETRGWGPPFVGEGRGESGYYLCINRNKRSIVVNFKTDKGRTIIQELIKQSDVLVENFRPGTLARFALDYDSVSALNPKLVYCSITGFGLTGSLRDRPGYDFIIQAMGGLMSITGEPVGEPMKVGGAYRKYFEGIAWVLSRTNNGTTSAASHLNSLIQALSLRDGNTASLCPLQSRCFSGSRMGFCMNHRHECSPLFLLRDKPLQFQIFFHSVDSKI
jgi:crotonobetainyl-CoA:carnitine CoA-transferase CaiB-like acyl-CoA transferase